MTPLELRALELFERALDVDPDQRQDWLDTRIGSDEALGVAVEKLVVADARATNFLDPEKTRMLSHLPGENIGRWRVLEPLAEGGMGAVLLVERDDETFRQRGALKLVRPDLLDKPGALRDSVIERFERERKVVARIEHANVARILDGGTDTRGVPFLVLEYVEGQSISEYCRRGGVTLSERLRLFRQLLSALAAAHRNLVIHRDVKPSNTLVTEGGQVKLIDFGIAKELPLVDEFDGDVTGTAFAAMTPDYASPEQVRNLPVTTSTDVYSAGLLLYELVASDKAYHLTGLSPADAERAIREATPTLPSEVARTRGVSFASNIRGDLDQIIMKAIRKEPDRRYASVGEFSADTERFLAGLPVAAQPDSWPYRTRKFISRNRVTVAVTGVAASLLLVAAIGSAWQSQQVSRAAQRADASNRFLVEMLMSSTPYSADHQVTLLDAIDEAEEKIAERFAQEPALEADLRQALGMAYQSMGRVEEGARQLEVALRLRRAMGTEMDIAESEHGMGLIAWWRGEYEATERIFRGALERLQRLDSDAAGRLRDNLANDLGAMLSEVGRAEAAEDLLEPLSRRTDLEDDFLRQILVNLATAYAKTDKHADAMRLMDSAVDLSNRLNRKIDPDFAILLNNRADLFIQQGQYEAALSDLTAAIQMHQSILGDETQLLIYPYANLARTYRLSGDLDKALTNANLAVNLADKTTPSGSPLRVRALLARGLVEEAQGDMAAVRITARQALDASSDGDGVRPDFVSAAEAMLARTEQGATEE